MGIQHMNPMSGRMIREDGSVVNVADLLAGNAETVGHAPIESYTPSSGRMIREDGSMVNIADEIAKGNIGGGNVTPEQIQTAVNAYLSEHPVESGYLSVADHIISIVGGGSNENT